MQGAQTGETVARAFVEARRTSSALAEFPGQRPATLADAYRIQDQALGIWGRKVGGWKVGRIGAPMDSRLGANRLIGPIFADTIFDANDRPAMPVFAGGFAAAEAEFMLQLQIPAGRDLPATDEETLDWIGQARIGLEIASSPYAGINADGACVTIADHGNNAGLVLGPAIPQDRWGQLCAVEIDTQVNGASVGRATAATMLDGPLGAVRFLLANLAERGIAAESGWWVSSGAVTGVHEVLPGDSVRAVFDGLGAVECSIIAG